MIYLVIILFIFSLTLFFSGVNMLIESKKECTCEANSMYAMIYGLLCSLITGIRLYCQRGLMLIIMVIMVTGIIFSLIKYLYNIHEQKEAKILMRNYILETPLEKLVEIESKKKDK